MTTNSVRVTLRSIKPPTSSGKPDSEPSTLSLLPNPFKSNNQPPSPNRRCSQLDIYEARSINHFWASSVFPALAALEEINKLPNCAATAGDVDHPLFNSGCRLLGGQLQECNQCNPWWEPHIIIPYDGTCLMFAQKIMYTFNCSAKITWNKSLNIIYVSFLISNPQKFQC